MKIAVFPGSFDPITLAHIDLIQRALPLFDKLYVAIGTNSNKKHLLSLDERKSILKEIFKDESKIMVSDYTGLTINYCQRIQASYILRGIRSVSDLEFEQPISQNNQLLDPTIQTVFLICSPGFSHISSTIVREIHQYNGDVSKLVPLEVINVLKRQVTR